MLHVHVFTGDGRQVIDPSIDDLRKLHQQDDTKIWVDLESVSSEELNQIAGIFGLVELTIEDLLVRGQRAKLESFEGYNVLIMHGMAFDPKTMEVEVPELDIVLGKNFLLTNHDGSMPNIMKDPQGPEHACMQVGKSTTLALYNVVDRLVDSYYPVLDVIDDTIDELELRILDRPSSTDLQQIFTLKHSLGTLRKVVSPQLEVFNRLIAREDEFIDQHFVVYFRDIYDHLVRTFEVIDSYRDLMSSAMDVYLSMISNRQNEIMKRLTLFASIFMPITFLTGVFGQNFGNMPQVQHDFGYLWWCVLAGMALLSAVQLVYYRRHDWI